MIDISVITPCYNSGEFLQECVDSVNSYQGKYHYEIIIINDGSTDLQTLELLKKLALDSNIIILNQENKGATSARNAGCEIARGSYLLFLDSDNKIIPDYIDIGINSLQENSEIGVVYGKPVFFGDNTRKGFNTNYFDIDKILINNYIDMCAVVRKSAWESVGGFDQDLKRLQDWEFWISLYKKSWKFVFIDKILFEYRILNNSISGKGNFLQDSRNKVFFKHIDILEKRFKELFYDNQSVKNRLEWKIGVILLKPYRFLQNFFNKS